MSGMTEGGCMIDGQHWGASEIAEEFERLRGDLNEARLQRDAKLCSQCPRTDAIERLRVIETEARKVVDLLRDVGQDTDWRDGTETDRVFAWYEFDGLRSALGEKDSGMTKDTQS